MLNRQAVERIGAKAYRADIELSNNPYLRTSRRNNGLMLAAWWDAGWKKAARK